jgi:hypothetical protein
MRPYLDSTNDREKFKGMNSHRYGDAVVSRNHSEHRRAQSQRDSEFLTSTYSAQEESAYKTARGGYSSNSSITKLIKAKDMSEGPRRSITRFLNSTSENSKYRLPRQGEPLESVREDYADIKVEGRRGN